MFGKLHFSSIFSLSRLLKDYLKECRKCKLLLFSFSGLWEAMCENSRKMSRYVASPDEQKEKTQQEMTMKTTARDPKLFEESKHLSKWKLGRKQQRSLEWRAEAPWSFPSFNFSNTEPLLFLLSWWPLSPPPLLPQQKQLKSFVSVRAARLRKLKRGWKFLVFPACFWVSQRVQGSW